MRAWDRHADVGDLSTNLTTNPSTVAPHDAHAPAAEEQSRPYTIEDAIAHFLVFFIISCGVLILIGIAVLI